MSVQIRSEVTVEADSTMVDFLVYDPNNYFAGTDDDELAWLLVGGFSIHRSAMHSYAKVLITPQQHHWMPRFPQTWVPDVQAAVQTLEMWAVLIVEGHKRYQDEAEWVAKIEIERQAARIALESEA